MDELTGPILYSNRNPDDPTPTELLGTSYLVLVDPDAQLVRRVHDKKKIAYAPKSLGSTLKSGYWYPYDGDPEVVTRLIPDLNIVEPHT